MKEYFSHDYNARNDTKLVKVFMKYQLNGIGAYWCIVEMLYEEGGYLLRSEYERISFELRTDLELIKSIVEDFDLFQKDNDKFWSDTAIDRLNKRSEKSAKARESVLKRWSKYKGNTNVEQTKSDSNTSKVKESKLKDIKIREDDFKNKVFLYKDKYSDEILNAFFNHWSQHGENDKKMLFEKKPSFEISKRLVTWNTNDKKFNHGQSRTNNTGNKAGEYHSGKDKDYSGKL